jgi:hypothetical protein
MRTISKALLSGFVLSLACASARAEQATGFIDLVGTNGSGASQTFNYNIHLTNTGTTNIESFWYAWLPPDNFFDLLLAPPTAETSPTGWTANLEGLGDGGSYYSYNSIQWDTTTNPLAPGQSLTFGYTSPSDFNTVTGSVYVYPVGYSYVYSGAPEADPGALVNVVRGSVVVPEPATIGLLAVGALSQLSRRRRRA